MYSWWQILLILLAGGACWQIGREVYWMIKSKITG